MRHLCAYYINILDWYGVNNRARIFCITLFNAYNVIYSTDNLDKTAKFQNSSWELFAQQKKNNAYSPWTIVCMSLCKMIIPILDLLSNNTQRMNYDVWK